MRALASPVGARWCAASGVILPSASTSVPRNTIFHCSMCVAYLCCLTTSASSYVWLSLLGGTSVSFSSVMWWWMWGLVGCMLWCGLGVVTLYACLLCRCRALGCSRWAGRTCVICLAHFLINGLSTGGQVCWGSGKHV
ncbi:hypothetical protein COO60DRAFT_745004 [Scenedesmus sp. NREL 46B-D3]|nr:hypothetical protein COO60DRAFT_745004 [Scenedesmus sp. NREL 46B-D3]